MLEGKKQNTFSVLWEIRSIFMQNYFGKTISALQHGRRENYTMPGAFVSGNRTFRRSKRWRFRENI